MSQLFADKRVRALAVLLLLGLSAAAWIGLADTDRSGMWVLGAYRTRWFLLAAGLTYFSLWFAYGALAGIGRTRVLEIVMLHVALALPIAAAELASVAGLVDFRQILGGGNWESSREHGLRRMTRPGVEYEGSVAPDLVRHLGVAAEPIPVAMRTDGFGLRNAKEKTDPRVVCLGDSILVAGLLPEEQILTERLEALLGAEVLNVSEAGYAPQEELIRYELTGLEPRGRLVLHFIFEGNDLCDSMGWREWTARSHGSDWPESGLVQNLFEGLRWASPGFGPRRHGRCGRDASDVWFLYDAGTVAGCMSELPALDEAIREASERFAAAGARYAVVFVPMKLHALHAACEWPAGSELADPSTGRTAFPRELEALTARHGIPYFDTTPLLAAAAETGELPYFGADTHLNAVGHDAIARGLAPWARALLEDGPSAP